MDALPTHFSAIVVSFHTGAILDTCLAALLDAPLCRQIILVNSGNPPQALAALYDFARCQPKLMIVDGHGNIGFGRGCNLGATHASEDLLVFVNPDCVIDEPTLPALAMTFTRYPNALIGGALRNDDGSEQRGCRRGELTLWSALVSFLHLGKSGEQAGIWRDFNRTREAFPTQVVEMPVVSGALMAMGAAQFKALGGFDPAFFLHVEDIDLCRRVREGGAHVLFDPNATGHHVGATSTVSSWAIERAKAASFARYFAKNARTVFDYAALVLVVPVLVSAIFLRAIVRR